VISFQAALIAICKTKQYDDSDAEELYTSHLDKSGLKFQFIIRCTLNPEFIMRKRYKGDDTVIFQYKTIKTWGYSDSMYPAELDPDYVYTMFVDFNGDIKSYIFR